jgi:hypothetical protein
MDFDREFERHKQRISNFGLLRFASVWLLVLSVVGLFVPGAAGWGITGIILAVILIVVSNAARSASAQRVKAMLEHAMFETPEGRQAIRDEATRRLRDHDY